MMLVLGIVLFGTTVLLPQYMQVWMGYSAEQAGLALSPGALVVILLLPVVGRLVSKYDARWLIAFGFAVLSLSLFHMTRTLQPAIDFRDRDEPARLSSRWGWPSCSFPSTRSFTPTCHLRRTTRWRGSSTWPATWRG